MKLWRKNWKVSALEHPQSYWWDKTLSGWLLPCYNWIFRRCKAGKSASIQQYIINEMKTQEFPVEILNGLRHVTLAWNVKEKIGSANRISGSSLMMADSLAGGFLSRKNLLSITTCHAAGYRSVVTSAYPASPKFEARRVEMYEVAQWLIG